MNSRWIAIESLLAAAVVTAAAVSSVASATAPANNGGIAFRRYFDAAHEWGAVFTINADGKDERQVTDPPRGTVDDQPDWSPDGTRILFQRCPSDTVCRVATVRPDGSDLRYLTPGCPPGQGPPDCTDIRGPAYSPDGREIVVGLASGPVKEFPGGGDQIEKFTLAVIDADGSGRRAILELGDYKGDLNYPQFSPDGTKLVFEQNNSRLGTPSSGRAVFVVNVDGTGLRRITPWQLGAGDAPDWSPNGKLLLFRSNVEATKQSQIYVARPDGTGLKRITHFKRGTTVTSYSFSPDGRWITFGKSGVNGEADIFLIRPNGTGIRPVTRTKLWDSAPDWGALPG